MTHEHHTADSLKQKLLSEIKEGKVAMTPRMYFVLKMAALALLAGAIVFVTIFIWNFIFFSLRINGQDALLGFGPRGFQAFMVFFPWHFLLLDIGLILVLQQLIKEFRFGYRVPALAFIAALIAFAGLVGFALDRGTTVNDRLHEGRGHLPPPVRGLYEGARRPLPTGSGICRCTVLSIDGNTITVEDTRNATTTLTVILPEDDRRATTTGIQVGDVIFIAGEEEDGVIHAFGVRKEGERGGIRGR